MRDKPLGKRVRLSIDTVPESENGIYVLKETRDVSNSAIGWGTILEMGEMAFLDIEYYGPNALEHRPKVGDKVNHRKFAGLTYCYKSGAMERELNDQDCFSIRNTDEEDELMRVY